MASNVYKSLAREIRQMADRVDEIEINYFPHLKRHEGPRPNLSEACVELNQVARDLERM